MYMKIFLFPLFEKRGMFNIFGNQAIIQEYFIFWHLVQKPMEKRAYIFLLRLIEYMINKFLDIS